MKKFIKIHAYPNGGESFIRKDFIACVIEESASYKDEKGETRIRYFTRLYFQNGSTWVTCMETVAEVAEKMEADNG